MTERDLTASAVAIRLWDAAAATCADAPDVAVVIDVALTTLEAGLRRWLGAEGYAALLSRAVKQVGHTHPAIAAIADLDVQREDARVIAPYDDTALRETIIALTCTMMQLLGGIIGDSMAIRLFEQAITQGQRSAAGLESNESPS